MFCKLKNKIFCKLKNKIIPDTNQDMEKIKKMNEENINLNEYILNVKTRIHDVKTPLNNIVLSVSNDDNITHENKLIIMENCYLIKELLDDLINKDGNFNIFEYNPSYINILKIIKKINYLIKSESKRFNIEVKLIFKNFICEYIYADQNLLIRVLINLIKNSLKYNIKNNMPIIVTFENKLHDEFIEHSISIIDFNDPIPSCVLDKLFQEFNKTNDSNGSGLGLYICKKIIELHNGSIKYSRQENYNKFDIKISNISLNFNNIKDIKNSISDSSSIISIKIKKLASKSQFDLKNINLLLIDDSTMTLKLIEKSIKKILKDMYDEINIDKLSNIDNLIIDNNNVNFTITKYDIIISDFHLGTYNCLDLIKFLRKNNYNGKIYCLTGDNDENINKSLNELNIDGILYKPVDLNELKKIMFII